MTRATTGPLDPRPCDRCGAVVFLARYMPHGGWGPFDADDVAPFTDTAPTARVVIGTQAWRPGDAIENVPVAHALTDEGRARFLVAGHPWHRPHECTPTTTALEGEPHQ